MFHVFCYESYYPSGGMTDYLGAFQTLEEAKDRVLRQSHEWYEIATVNKEGWLEILKEGNRNDPIE